MSDSQLVDLNNLSPFIIDDFWEKKNSYSLFAVSLSVSSLTNVGEDNWYAQNLDYLIHEHDSFDKAKSDFDNFNNEDSLKNYILEYMEIEPESLFVKVFFIGKENKYDYGRILVSNTIVF